MKMQALDCPKCGASVAADSRFCSHCGSGLILDDDRIRFYLVGALCPQCGADNQPTDRYCGRCGEPLLRTCPYCFEDVPVDSSHCNACGVDIDAWREELSRQADRLDGEINSRRAVRYVVTLLAIAVVIGGFYTGSIGALGGLLLGALSYGFVRVLRRTTNEKIEELDTIRNSLQVSEIG